MSDTTTTATEVVTSRVLNGVEHPAVGNYVLDPLHTSVGFTVRHMAVSKVRGTFKGVEGTLEIAERPEDSKVTVTIDPNSVETGEPEPRQPPADGRLLRRGQPSRVAVRVHGRPGDGAGRVRGRRRPHHPGRDQAGDARSRSLGGVVTDPYGLHRVGFSAKTSINRDDFGVSFGAVMETGGLVVAKKVDIEIDAEATRQS